MTTEAAMRQYLAQASESEVFLIDSIWADPTDPVNRLVYSDLVEEAGDQPRAQRIRKRLELDRVPCFACRGTGKMKNRGLDDEGHLTKLVYDLPADADIDCSSCGGKGEVQAGYNRIEWVLGF